MFSYALGAKKILLIALAKKLKESGMKFGEMKKDLLW
jgi:hypothetical protein